MKSITMLCPYFGRLPSYFTVVLNSMKLNPSVNWLIFTDDNTSYDYPSNVKVVSMTFADMQTYIKIRMPIDISLPTVYKLCDYKPFYGIIFREYLIDADFWGYCDFDCIFGDIRHFMTSSILDIYDKCMWLGHFTIYRNTEKISNIIADILKKPFIQKALLDSENYGLDERTLPYLLRDYEISVYDNEEVIGDIYCLHSNFTLVKAILTAKDNDYRKMTLRPIMRKERGIIFKRTAEGLYGYYLVNNKLVTKEYMYCHLQKRKMAMQDVGERDFWIVPNTFMKDNGENEAEMVKKYRKWFFYWPCYMIMYKKLKYRLKKIISNKYIAGC
ncbi:MAG: hypothetical protein IJ849_05025 [Selenomonadaceae bacterium]|nr:hypothetical protein [Selenomonadaceae bacterium]